MIVVAFATPSYNNILDTTLLPSLNKFNIPRCIYRVEEFGGWSQNIKIKPEICIMALNELNDDILLVDADAEFTKYPDIFQNLNCDIAANFLDWFSHYGHNKGKEEFLSGTLFLKNNTKVKRLVQDWSQRVQSTNIWEQRVLEEILKERKDLNIHRLSREYCYIATRPNGGPPHISLENPIIIHHQASRQFRNLRLKK